MPNQNGLEVFGLTKSMIEFCRKEHSEFLNRHALPAWPLIVRVTPVESAPEGPAGYRLEVQYGIPRSIWRRVTTQPEVELCHVLRRMLEINFVRYKITKGKPN